MIPPITIIVAENTPSRRAYPGEFSGSLRVKWRLRGGFWAATFLRGPGSRGCSPRTRPIADDAFRSAVALRAPVDLQLRTSQPASQAGRLAIRGRRDDRGRRRRSQGARLPEHLRHARPAG